MEIANNETEEMLDYLVEDTLQLGINMQLFSLFIRSLYAENSISSSVENGPAFIQLRDATRNDAVVYLKARTEKMQPKFEIIFCGFFFVISEQFLVSAFEEKCPILE